MCSLEKKKTQSKQGEGLFFLDLLVWDTCTVSAGLSLGVGGGGESLDHPGSPQPAWPLPAACTRQSSLQQKGMLLPLPSLLLKTTFS